MKSAASALLTFFFAIYATNMSFFKIRHIRHSYISVRQSGGYVVTDGGGG